MIDALPTFVAVAESGSFSVVARAQGVSVSSVTRRIDALETEFQSTLFRRSSRRVLLTDAGEHLLGRAKFILSELADAKEGLTSLNAEPAGSMTVTAPSTFGRRHIAPAVIDFLRKHPSMRVDLHLSDRIVDLEQRGVDVAIRMGAVTGSGLVATRLAPLRRIACASPSYLKREGRPEGPLDLLKHNCLTAASEPIPPGWWSFVGIRRTQPLPIKGNFRTDDTEALLQAAISGIGVVHLASWLVSDAIRQRKLVALFPSSERSEATGSAIYAVRLVGRASSRKAQLFIAHLRETIGETPEWDAAMSESEAP